LKITVLALAVWLLTLKKAPKRKTQTIKNRKAKTEETH
jgi:hypothetical protein